MINFGKRELAGSRCGNMFCVVVVVSDFMVRLYHHRSAWIQAAVPRRPCSYWAALKASLLVEEKGAIAVLACGVFSTVWE